MQAGTLRPIRTTPFQKCLIILFMSGVESSGNEDDGNDNEDDGSKYVPDDYGFFRT